MKAFIITIGDEILLGQIVDTNATFIARALAAIGIETTQILSIADNAPAIADAIKTATKNADIIIITGGLGPTKDDITKHTLAAFFDVPLNYNQQADTWLQQILTNRKTAANPLNATQAHLPQNCAPLHNPKGTACGMLFEVPGKTIIALPGVPFEMEIILQNQVLPLLKNRFNDKIISYKMLKVYDVSESALAITLADFEDSLPTDITLAYLPSTDMVKLRLTAKGAGVAALGKYFGVLKNILKNLNFTEGEDNSLIHILADIFTSKKLKLATAESCTGGNIAHQITLLQGASAYFLGGIIAYANEVKINVLGVNAVDISTHGTVSEQVVKQMALGARKLTGADYAVATSGIAGPCGGTSQKPVGTVWIAVAGPNGVIARQFLFSNVRERNIGKSTAKAIEMLVGLVVRT